MKPKKRRHKKLKKDTLFLLAVFCITTVLLFIILQGIPKETNASNNTIVKGQMRTQGKNGYDTIFCWGERKYIEYKQNKGSWKNLSYWDNTVETDGCGITALSIIASGYGEKVTPKDLRDLYYPHLAGDSIPTALEEDLGIPCSDFIYQSSYFTVEKVGEHLKQDKPILVCVNNRPDDRWTTASHYLVLLGMDEEQNIYVSNPNGDRGSAKQSDWYKPSEILPYIVKGVWIY